MEIQRRTWKHIKEIFHHGSSEIPEMYKKQKVLLAPPTGRAEYSTNEVVELVKLVNSYRGPVVPQHTIVQYKIICSVEYSMILIVAAGPEGAGIQLAFNILHQLSFNFNLQSYPLITPNHSPMRVDHGISHFASVRIVNYCLLIQRP